MTTTAAEAVFHDERTCGDELRVYRATVAAIYRDRIGRLDLSLLWSRNSVKYFRANWWRTRSNGFEQYIASSAFVAIRETAAGLIVEEQTAREAA